MQENLAGSILNRRFWFLQGSLWLLGRTIQSCVADEWKQENLSAWMKNAGVPEHIFIRKFVFHSRVPDYMGLGDFAISPYKPVPSRKYSAPIKNSEYWALGLPVIITKNIADDSKIIKEEGIGAVIENLTDEDYLKAIKTMDQLLKENTSINCIKKFALLLRNNETFQG